MGSGAGDVPLLLKAFTAQHRTPLAGTKWDRRLFTTMRTIRPGFRLHIRLPVRSSQYRDSLALAVLATFGFILELLVMEEQLFPGSKNKI